VLALGVIAIERQGFRFSYHFKVIWERLYQVIVKFQREQYVPTEKGERPQNVPTEPVQNAATQPSQWQQNVSTKWKQNAATYNRENNTENKEIEKTDREKQETWDKTREQITSDLPFGETAHRLAGTALIEISETKAVIGVSNRFAIPWLERRLYGQIAKALKTVIGKTAAVLPFLGMRQHIQPSAWYVQKQTLEWQYAAAGGR
jgi:hypothetical protein